MTDAALAERSRVNGHPVSVQEAITAAATLLAASRSAVVAGLGTDVAGARASVALARAIGASLDHMEAGAVFANLDVMRRTGWIVTTPLQTRARADTVLLVGDGLLEAWPELVEQRLALNAAPTLTGSQPGGSRRVLHVRPGTSPRVMAGSSGRAHGPPNVMPGPAIHDLHTFGEGKPILPTLAALRAIVAGRRTSLDEAATAPLRTLASALTEARFGVAIWSAAALDTLAVEMLCGLIDDLNKKTRFAGLPLPPVNGAEAVTQALTWTTGFPPRTGFAGSSPLHDPWRFEAARLVANGEADAAVWVSAFSPTPQPWDGAVPTVALVPPGTVFQTPPAVVFEVGCPGRDHDAMLFDPALGGIAFAAASAPSGPGSVARVLAGITAALPTC
jgi:formylmethanofuran dehydrogenase subunit B